MKHLAPNGLKLFEAVIYPGKKILMFACKGETYKSLYSGHYVIVPNVTIPKLVKIPNINRNPTIPPTKLGEGEVLSSYPDLT